MYRADLPDDSLNVSSSNPLTVAFKLTAALTVIAVAAYFAMGFVINMAASSVTPEQEVGLEKLLSFDLNISEESNRYLDRVAGRLSSCADLPYDIKVRVVNDKELNAFAVPGGWIYITKGILEKMQSENELAFIVGHELGHFKHKDHLKALGYKLIFGVLSMMLGSDYGIAASMTLGIGSAKYSQSAELDADEYGLEVMNCAYGTVSGATDMFEKMDKGDEWKYFMATHPGFKTRVYRMKEIIADKNYDTSKKLIPLGKF